MAKTPDPTKPKRKTSAKKTSKAETQKAVVPEAPLEPEEILQIVNKVDAIPLAEAVYQLWLNCADFEISVLSPTLPVFDPGIVIAPELTLDEKTMEFVYPIHDYGFRLRTSKQDEMFSAGRSMCKLHYTIEKMIFILIERLQTEGIEVETEVQVVFGGHKLAQRKGFEVIINLDYNVVVTNFDPGAWGERYLKMVKEQSGRFGTYPAKAPRDFYRQARAGSGGGLSGPR